MLIALFMGNALKMPTMLEQHAYLVGPQKPKELETQQLWSPEIKI